MMAGRALHLPFVPLPHSPELSTLETEATNTSNPKWWEDVGGR